MKHLLQISLLLFFTICSAQPKLELTPQGFQPLEMPTPNRPLDQLMEGSKNWAPYFNKKTYDIFDVTENSLSIEARVENGYYYYNVGVKYNCDIVYTLKIEFRPDKKYTLAIAVKEIYAKNVLTKTTVADFFTADGKLKDDFRDAKPSLENTINKIVKSYVNFINQ
ncbi:hypothetical protein [Flavobacterium wongokense]|uniref:hypothetical protein n=1 Tax=Flavobacterium wongokense TaxID=2910674 RepID=UPI001F423008|nr:hypothetical protein [Flavobacterium sp. WG47]MCF6132876.1 hypothetical protein [Flavobacterium sp. WG47]